MEIEVTSVVDQIPVRNFAPFHKLVDKAKNKRSYGFGYDVNIEKINGRRKGRHFCKCHYNFRVCKGIFKNY